MMQDQDKIDHEAISNRQAAKCRSESIDLFALESSLAEANVLLKSSPFFKFVLTGGPCGGKTTSLARLSSYLRERGFEVMTAPEAFTILAGNGFRMDYFSVDGMPKCEYFIRTFMY
jgi:signal recognition particle GTPase